MIVTTSSGFECEVNESISEDWRFVKAVAQADSSDESDQLQGYTKIISLMLGEAGEKKLEDHVKRPDGIVPLKAINNEVIELIRAIKEKKTVKN